MKKNKTLHILALDIFTVGFIQFINKEFNPNEHLFLCVTKPEDNFLHANMNIRFLYSPNKKNLIRNAWIFYNSSRKASKIIFHGNPIFHYFFLFPWLLKKTFWAIYGYELRNTEIYEKKSISDSFHSYMKRFVLKRISGHITHIKGDSDLANIQFKSSANFYYSPMYLSNVITIDNSDDHRQIKSKEVKNIMVGNSTSPTNNHSAIFKMLLPYREENIVIYCPLSYGTFDDYKNEVMKNGKLLFGEKFVPVTNYMEPFEYNSFLKNMDIVIFNHNRQEAMGVTLNLIGMGKIVYLNSETTSYKSLIDRGIRIFDNRIIEKEGLFVKRDVSMNADLLYPEYSYQRLIISLKTIFSSNCNNT